jgi:PAS domain-containing protein
MVLPSLILRLEQLPEPEAVPQPDDAPEHQAAHGPDLTDTRTATHGIGTVRRIVDVAAPERLSTATPLSRWSAAVAAAHDACFVLDLHGVVISVSMASVELLGCGDAAVIGRHILEVVNLVDLETGAPHPDYAPRITPLAVLDGPGLARSMMRVRHPDNAVVTLDSSSAPIHDVTGHLLGSVTFLAPIPAR